MKLKIKEWVENVTIEIKTYYIYIVILQGHNISTGLELKLNFGIKL